MKVLKSLMFILCLIAFHLKFLSTQGFTDDLTGTNETPECLSEKCTCDTKSIVKCSGFESFAELNFETYSLKQIDVLDLRPLKPILLDDSLRLHSFRVNKQVILRNLAGFDYKSTPFTDLNVQLSKDGLSIVELKLYDSEFEFFENADTMSKLNAECTMENFSNRTTLLAKFAKIWLNENTKYSQSLCPLVFHNVSIDLFLAHQMNTKNRLKFKPVANITEFIKSKIGYLSLINAKLDRLDSSLVDKDVFSNLKTFQLLGSLNEMQADFFSSFKFLKSILFELFNFGDFIRSNSEWMAYLRNDNAFDSSKRDLLIILNDKNKMFEYSESEFCLFRHFPNENFVYPVIKTKFNLTCSCTLLWMLKNWKLYKSKQSGANIIQTQSVDRCINSSVFEADLDKCDFSRRINECNDTKAFTSLLTKTSAETTALLHKQPINKITSVLSSTTSTSIARTSSSSSSSGSIKPKMPLPPLGGNDFNSKDIENDIMNHLTDRRRPTTRNYFYTTTIESYSNYYLNPISIIDMAAGAISLVGFFVVIGVLGFILFA